MIDWFKVKLYLRNRANNFLLWAITKVNKGKSRVLSQKLFDLAERYNTRPGKFNYNNKNK